MQKTMKCRACAILLLAATLLGVLLCLLPLMVGASSVRDCSDVLADLKQDPSFNTDEYPVVNNDSAINFIHLAESEQGEVLIYVYQPHQTYVKYRASSINISATTDGSLLVKNYYLDLVDYDGVFQKYVVRDLSAQTKNERVYEVISIYRMFDAAVDQGLSDDNDNTIQEVVYPVAKKYEFKDTPNGLSTAVSDLQYIQVTDKYVGFMRYPAGWHSHYPMDVDVHFVAFSTNYKMDKLLEADVFYVQQSYSLKKVMGVDAGEEYGDKEEKYAYLQFDENMQYTGAGWFSQEYSWNTIEKSEDFLNSSSGQTLYSKNLFFTTYANSIVNEGARQEIANCDWVLRFAVTELSQTSTSTTGSLFTSTIVGEVSILRLAFETDGQYYNLPVIDNKQSGSLTPSNKIEYEVQASEWWQKIMMVLLIILAVVLLTTLWGPISFVLKIFCTGLWIGLKVFLWLLSLPFKLIGRLFKRKR